MIRGPVPLFHYSFLVIIRNDMFDGNRNDHMACLIGSDKFSYFLRFLYQKKDIFDECPQIFMSKKLLKDKIIFLQIDNIL